MLRSVKIGACAALSAVIAVLVPGVAAAAPSPANDAVEAPVALDGAQSSVSGTTDGATLAKTDPTAACDEQLTATVWYSLTNVPARDVVLRLTAQDGLAAVVGVYRLRNGRLRSLSCAETEDNGVATLGVTARNGDLVLVGQTTGSGAGAFTLQALVPEAPEALPGRELRGVARSSVEELLDESDLWSAHLFPGTTYRISLVATTPDACPTVKLFQPGGPPSDARELLDLRCNSATSFTPGPEGGGRYLLIVELAYGDGRIPYRLQVARAEADDTAPGLKLPVGVWRRGRLAPSTIDQLDMYRFSVAARSDVTLQLASAQPSKASLLLLRDTGSSLASGRAIRRQLAPGMYYVVVSAPTGTPAAAYRLRLRERGISTLTAQGLDHGHVPFGTELAVSAVIGKPAGRTAVLEIDRFDPLHGWLYVRTFRVAVSAVATASFAWRPPHVGAYRVRVVAPSRSRYLLVTVDDINAGP
jgi:hypothetical protein